MKFKKFENRITRGVFLDKILFLRQIMLSRKEIINMLHTDFSFKFRKTQKKVRIQNSHKTVTSEKRRKLIMKNPCIFGKESRNPQQKNAS